MTAHEHRDEVRRAVYDVVGAVVCGLVAAAIALGYHGPEERDAWLRDIGDIEHQHRAGQ